MKFFHSRLLIFVLLAGFGVIARAQNLDTGPVTPIEYLRPLKNSFSVGVRVVGGAKVQFSGNLGVTPYTAAQRYATQSAAQAYDNGTVFLDSNSNDGSIRPVYSSNTALSGTLAPGGVDGRFYTYIVGADGTLHITGDYVMYDESKTMTRSWSINSDSQVSEDRKSIGFSSYATTSAGQSVEADGGASPGIELQGARVIQRFKRFEWGIAVGFGMSEFNAKTRKSIGVNLAYVTDWYNVYSTGPDFKGTPTLGGTLPVTTGSAATLGGPSFNTNGAENGGISYPVADDPETEDVETTANGTLETTTPISQNPAGTATSGVINAGDPGGATVDGYWQVKGVYYLLRVGPMVRIPIGKRFSAYASGGYMAGWIGSKFRYDEWANFPDGAARRQIVNAVSDSKLNQQYIDGYYFDVNFEWWLTTRTGFYAGLAYEKLGKYEQTFDQRKASIKMDNGLGWRFGIITRF